MLFCSIFSYLKTLQCIVVVNSAQWAFTSNLRKKVTFDVFGLAISHASPVFTLFSVSDTLNQTKKLILIHYKPNGDLVEDIWYSLMKEVNCSHRISSIYISKHAKTHNAPQPSRKLYSCINIRHVPGTNLDHLARNVCIRLVRSDTWCPSQKSLTKVWNKRPLLL